jgi:DNA ligase D
VAERVEVEVAGRTVSISSPDRLMFPGVTKLDLARYYASVAPAMMGVLRDRPTTLERWPEGVHEGAESFYGKHAPKGMPDWVQTARVTFPSGRTAQQISPTEPAVIVWAANLSTVTFHPWAVHADHPDHPDELRLDFDPQPGTSYADAVAIALAARDLLGEHRITAYAKTSGGRGVHVFARFRPEWDFIEMRHAAIAVGRELERRLPGRVTTAWWKEQRGECVFVDYNQNARDRTIASAWSVRARSSATVSTPIEWSDLGSADPDTLTVQTVPQRLAELGDPWHSMGEQAHDLTPLLLMWQADVDRGMPELNYPPDYPKMPGEPPRVQPSRARRD